VQRLCFERESKAKRYTAALVLTTTLLPLCEQAISECNQSLLRPSSQQAAPPARPASQPASSFARPLLSSSASPEVLSLFSSRLPFLMLSFLLLLLLVSIRLLSSSATRGLPKPKERRDDFRVVFAFLPFPFPCPSLSPLAHSGTPQSRYSRIENARRSCCRLEECSQLKDWSTGCSRSGTRADGIPCAGVGLLACRRLCSGNRMGGPLAPKVPKYEMAPEAPRSPAASI
jgi:hypothetical protein